MCFHRQMGKISNIGCRRKMGKTSKGRGLPEKWPKNDKNENRVGSSRKRDKINTGCIFIEKLIKLVILVVGRKTGQTSKGRGLHEKWPKKGENKSSIRSSRKRDKMNMGYVFIGKWTKLVRLVVGRKTGKTSKGRGLPEKWPKKGENKNSIGSSRKCDKMNTGWVFMEKYVEWVRLVVGRKMGKTSKGRGLPKNG